MDGGRQCEGQTRGGDRCRARPLHGSRFCYFHHPEKADSRAAGRQKGGKVRSKRAAVLPAATPDVPLDSVKDVTAFLGASINQVRRGELDVKVGNCVGYLASVLLKSLEEGELEERIAALEAQHQRGKKGVKP
jgi:hypothetical protein